MISKPANAHKRMEGYYTHRIHPIRFGHPYGHLKGDALQRIDTSKRYKRF